MSDRAYYIRIRGRVLGPYSMEQLAALRNRSQFSRAHEVSTDRQVWQSAATLETLFGDGKTRGEASRNATRTREPEIAPETAARAATAEPPRRDLEPVWHYDTGNDEKGPVTLADLRALVAAGTLAAESAVWREGMPDWILLRDVPELALLLGKARPRASADQWQQIRDAGMERLERYSDVASRSVWDGVLSWFRDAFPAARLKSIADSLLQVGIYSLFLAMFVAPLYLFLVFAVGTKIIPPADDRLKVILACLAAFMVLALSQYVVRRVAYTMFALVQATSSRLNGTAFLDVLALVWLFLGAAQIACFFYLAFAYGTDITLLLPFFAGVALAVFQACLCLHPKLISVETTEPTSLGEEGVGIASVFIKVHLQSMPVRFGIACVIGTGGLTFATLLYFLGPAYELRSLLLGAASGALIAFGALWPVLVYLAAVLLYVIPDVLRSILIMPSKIDQMIDAGARSKPDGRS